MITVIKPGTLHFDGEKSVTARNWSFRWEGEQPTDLEFLGAMLQYIITATGAELPAAQDARDIIRRAQG